MYGRKIITLCLQYERVFCLDLMPIISIDNKLYIHKDLTFLCL